MQLRHFNRPSAFFSGIQIVLLGCLPTALAQNMEAAVSHPRLLPAQPIYDTSKPSADNQDEDTVDSNHATVSSEEGAAARALRRDLEMVATLVAPGWNSIPPLICTAAEQGLVASDGRSPLEIGGQSTAILNEYGCTDAVSRLFRKGQSLCAVNVYTFAKAEGAFGAYSVMRKGASTVVVRGDASSENDDSISIWKNNRLIFLNASSENDDEAMALLSKFAGELSAKAEGNAQLPLLCRQLPGWEKIKGSEKLFMGPLSLRRYSTVPFGGSLLTQPSQMAVVADYAIGAPYQERLKFLLLECGDSTEARSIFGGYAMNIGLAGDVVDRSGEQVLAKVSNGYLMCRLAGSQIVVISGARKKYSPLMLFRQLHQFNKPLQ